MGSASACRRSPPGSPAGPLPGFLLLSLRVTAVSCRGPTSSVAGFFPPPRAFAGSTPPIGEVRAPPAPNQTPPIGAFAAPLYLCRGDDSLADIIGRGLWDERDFPECSSGALGWICFALADRGSLCRTADDTLSRARGPRCSFFGGGQGSPPATGPHSLRAFLGYNPIKHLIGTSAPAHLPAGQAALLTGRSFFPASSHVPSPMACMPRSTSPSAPARGSRHVVAARREVPLFGGRRCG